MWKQPYYIKHEVEARVVETPADYQQVLELRATAYTQSGKVPSLTTFEETQALGDAKVVAFFHQGTIVGSFVVRFPVTGTLLESVDLPLGDYPKCLPPKEDTIEIGKFCVDRRYRGTNLTIAMFQEVHRALVLSQRHYILICSEPRLVPKYLAIGFWKTGLEFWKNGKFSILLTKQSRFGVYGLHAGPFRWNLILSEISRDMWRKEQIRPSAVSLVFWTVYSAFGPLAFALENRMIANKRRAP